MKAILEALRGKWRKNSVANKNIPWLLSAAGRDLLVAARMRRRGNALWVAAAASAQDYFIRAMEVAVAEIPEARRRELEEAV